MTCDRAYTDAAILALQAAELRRQHRAELADELRQWLSLSIEIGQESGFAQGWDWAIEQIKEELDRLSPPVVCDSREVA